MMPPVSLPWNGGTVSMSHQCACAGAAASIPPMTVRHMATRHAAIILRIADSVSLGAHHSVRRWPWKEWCRHETELAVRCCRAALDLNRASRHRLARWLTGGFPMRNLFTSLRSFGPIAAAFAVL